MSAPPQPTAIRPFPGLRPFKVDETHLFFGRERDRRELLKRMSLSRFIAVVGTSGSGKSSLIHAGLLPDISSGYLPRAGSDWVIVTTSPRNDPIGRLAAAFNAVGWSVTERELRTNSKQIVEMAARLLTRDQHLLVLVDQFEESFRFTVQDHPIEDRNEKASFVRLLLEAGGQTPESVHKESPRIHVVLAMRSEFLGLTARFSGLPEAIDQGQYLIPRLSREQLRKAIEAPVDVAQGKIEGSLVQRLLNELGDDQDQLPVLQHALMRTWEHCHPPSGVHSTLDHAAYEAVGGLRSALSRDASEALEQARALVPDEGLRIVKRAFQSLRETDPNGGQVRRPTSVSDLCEIAGCEPAALNAALAPFRQRSFLIPDGENELSLTAVIDVSHEALLRRWSTLNDWIEEDESHGQRYLQIARRASEKPPQHFTDPMLSVLDRFWNERKPTRLWAIRRHPGFNEAREFLEDSLRYQRALDNAAKRKRRYSIGAVVVVAIFLAVAYFYQRLQSRNLEALLLATVANTLDDDTQAGARMQLAAEAFKLNPVLVRDLFLESILKSAKPITEMPIGGTRVALSSKGDVLFTASKEGQLVALNAETGTEIFNVNLAYAKPSVDPVILPTSDGEKLVVAAEVVTIVDAKTGRIIATPPIPWPVNSTISKDGRIAAFISDREIYVCELSDNCAAPETHPARLVYAASSQGAQTRDVALQRIAASPDGTLLAVAGTPTATGTEVAFFQITPWSQFHEPRTLPREDLLGMKVDQDYSLRLCWRDAITLHNPASHRSPLEEKGSWSLGRTDVIGCAFSDDEIATSHRDGVTRVWTVWGENAGSQVVLAGTGSTSAFDVALSDRTMATSGDKLRVWDVTRFGEKFGAPSERQPQTTFVGNGAYLQSSDALYGLESPSKPLPTLTGPRSRVLAIRDSLQQAFFTTGAALVFADVPESGAPIERWKVEAGAVRPVSISDDGKFAGVIISSSQITIYDASSGGKIREISGSSYQFVPNRDEVLVRGNEDLKVWPIPEGESKSVLSVPGSRIDRFAVSPDGRYLAVTREAATTDADRNAQRPDREISLWTWPDLQLVKTLAHRGPLSALTFGPDSNALLYATQAGIVSAWDIGKDTEIVTIPAIGRPYPATFTPTGSIAFLDNLGMTVLPMKPSDWQNEVCLRLSRNLSAIEWENLVGANVSYRKTCSNLP